MRVTVTVADAKSPFLPVPGQPVSLSANTADAVFGFDSATGDLVLDSTPGPGLDYTVTGWVGPATVGVASGPVLHSSQGSVNTPSPQLPAALVSFAAHLTASTTSDPARLEALATELRRFPYSTQAPAGHSLGAIVRMLAGSAFADHLGYSEQHAAAFAVLARAMGFPARVAVGYLLHNSQDGVFTITEHDVHVWPEVLTRDGGWIAFEPTDTRQLLATSLDSAPPPPATGSTPPPPPKQPQSKVEIVTAPVGKPLLTVRLLVIAIASLFAAAGIVAMGVVAIKSHRRRRRHRATPPMAAVIGAWRETTDRLVERGLPLTPATTPSEVAALVSERIPHAAGPLHALAELATTAIYGPGDGELRNAELAWRLERGVRLLLRTSVRGRLHSCVAMVDPRPLFPRNARHLPRQGCRVARGASRSRTWAQ
jgi:hypothetical protein